MDASGTDEASVRLSGFTRSLTEVAPTTSYSKYHKKYYENHKAAITEKRNLTKPWLAYYAQHAEEERARKRAAYARKKAILTCDETA